MQNNNELDDILGGLKSKVKLVEPNSGHEKRFSQKLEKLPKKEKVYKMLFVRKLAIAASLVAIFTAGFWYINTQQQPNEIKVEAAQMEYYFTNLVNNELERLEQNKNPETNAIIDEAVFKINELEGEYKELEKLFNQDINPRFILNEMLNNFQLRIDLIQDVLQQLEKQNNNNINYETQI